MGTVEREGGSLEDFKNRWKQIGLGGGSVLLVMALFQERGIEFLDRTRDSELKAVYVRTDAIELRVEKIEQQLLAFNEKFDNKLSGWTTICWLLGLIWVGSLIRSLR
jgi:hypothetical protein